MLNDQALTKLQELIKIQHPELGEAEIRLLAEKYFDFGQFLVQLWLKEANRAIDNGNGKEKNSEPTNSPG